MHKKMMAVVAAVLALSAGAARAADVQPGFGASLRLGYALPMGGLTGDSGNDLSKWIAGTIPLQLDVGYRFTPNISAAVYFAYGFNRIGSDLDNACKAQGVSCSAGHDMRAGIEAFWHFMPGQSMDPWAGLGFGYEWATVGMSQGGQSLDLTVKGFELLNLQGGVDWTVSPGFGVGPFIQFSMGKYSTQSASGSGVDQSQDINNTAMHEWLQLGVRGTFNL